MPWHAHCPLSLSRVACGDVACSSPLSWPLVCVYLWWLNIWLDSGLICIVLIWLFLFSLCLPSVLWHCWLGIRKCIRLVKIEWWGVGVIVCLNRDVDCLRMVLLMPLPSPSSLASFKSRVVLPFWYRLTQVTMEKRSLNGSSSSSFSLCLAPDACSKRHHQWGTAEAAWSWGSVGISNSNESWRASCWTWQRCSGAC